MVSKTEKICWLVNGNYHIDQLLKSLANKAFKSKQSSKAYIRLIGGVVLKIKIK